MVQFASYLRHVLCKTRLIFPRINGPNVQRTNHIASPGRIDQSRKQATFLNRVPVYCVTPFCSDALVSPPNLYPPLRPARVRACEIALGYYYFQPDTNSNHLQSCNRLKTRHTDQKQQERHFVLDVKLYFVI